jgi:predicted Ser/Thr protein kinase
MGMKKNIVVNEYKKYWIEDTKHGSLIKICYGNDDRVLTIDLRWGDRQRAASGRVFNIKRNRRTFLQFLAKYFRPW